MKKTTILVMRLLMSVSLVMMCIASFAQSPNPRFVTGPSVLCVGTGSCYQATTSTNATIRYSIVSGGASIDEQTGCVTNVTSSFVIRATATDARGANPVTTDFQVSVPIVSAPVPPTAQWVFGSTAQSFTFSNVTAGNGGNQIEWSTNGSFSNSQVAASPANISTTVNAYSSNVLFIRTRDDASGCVSDPVTTLARVVVEPNTTASAQTDPNTNYAHCGTDLYRQALYRDDPAAYRGMIDLDNQIIQKVAMDQAVGRPKSQTEYVIPVVVHVVTEQGTGPGISYAQIQSQINAMNAAFAANYSGYNGGTNDPSAVNTTIRFCLANNTIPSTILWSNPSEPGVMRYSSSDPNVLSPSANSLSGSASLTALTGYPTNFPPSKYFNIWVVPHIVMTGLQPGAEVLGFATFPNETSSTSYSSYVDGMVIQAKVFGDNSLGGGYPLMVGEDEGKVAVHEAGHYLATYHVFEPNGVGANTGICPSANSPGCLNDGDLCCDTRPCDIRFGACNNANDCPNPGGTDYPVANFMNYLDENCVSAFTHDQWQNRMLPALDLTTSNRNSLWQTANLAATGVACGPCIITADISYQFGGTCPGAGNPIDFSTPQGSMYCADNWNWTFTGGTPATSTLANPTSSFASPGDYTVSLTACAGASPCVTQSTTVHVNSGAFQANITPLTTTVCYGNSAQIEINITNQVGPFPDTIELSNGDIVITYFAYTTWVLQNITSSETITIVSINHNTCPASFTGQADITVVQCCASNLVTNGDFEAGNVGFTCPDLIYDAISQNAGKYNVYVPRLGATGWGVYDSIQNIGNSLVIDGDKPQNGAPTTGVNGVDTIVWNENVIPIVPCTDYQFSFDVTDAINIDGSNAHLPVRLAFEIVDGSGTVLNPGQTYDVPIVPNFATPNATGPRWNFYWNQATFNWNSGATPAGNYTLRIQQIDYFYYSGSDYALDNITFSRVVGSCTVPANERFDICQGSCVTLGNTIPATGIVTWTPTIGLSDPNLVNPSACPLESNIYTASAYLNDATYCGTYTIHDTVNVDDLAADNTTPTYVVCNLPPAQNIGGVTVTGGFPPYSYQWSPIAGLSATNIINPDASAPGLYTLTITDSHNCTAQVSANIETEMTLTLNATSASCGSNCDGAIDLTVSSPGSLGPYTYLWSNGATTEDISNACPGVYTVTVTDGLGCSSTATTTVGGGMTITMSQPDTICHGTANGTASVTVNGGTPPFVYLWDYNNAATSTITGLGAGTYSVTVNDASGCSSTGSTTVVEADTLVASVTNTPSGCAGSAIGTATVNAVGGVPPYTYLWNNGATTATATNLTSGIYIVTVTDGVGCTALSGTFVGSFPLQLSVTVTNVGCYAASPLGTATVTAIGGLAPYSYSWDVGGTTSTIGGLLSGSYTVEVTDATGCVANITAVVHQATPITASITPLTTTVCSGSSQAIEVNVLNGGFPPYTIVFSNGESIITSPTLGAPFSTTYILQNITSSQNISIVSINGNICPDTLSGVANINVVQCCACNLLTNGNFEDGNIGFLAPDLTYSNPMETDGDYNIYSPAVGVANPFHQPGYWFTTSGLQNLGNSLVIDGTASPHEAGPPPSSILWQEDNIQLDPCSNYEFKFDVTSAYLQPPPGVPIVLQFEILDAFGNVLNPGQTYQVPLIDLALGNVHWNQVDFNWNSGAITAGGYTLRILQINNFNSDGGDYAIDNIALCKVSSSCAGLTGQSFSTCAGNCVTIGTNIPPSATVSWSPATSLIDATVNSPTACPTTSTIYTATVTITQGAGTLCGTYTIYDTVNIVSSMPTIHIDTTVCDTAHAVIFIPAAFVATGMNIWTRNGLPYSPDPLYAPNLLLTESGTYTLIHYGENCTDTMIVNAEVDSCGVCSCPPGWHCCTNVHADINHIFLVAPGDGNNNVTPVINFNLQVFYSGPSGSQINLQIYDPVLASLGYLTNISSNTLQNGFNDISGQFVLYPNGDGNPDLFCLDLVIVDSLTGDTCHQVVCDDIPICQIDVEGQEIHCSQDSAGHTVFQATLFATYYGHNNSSFTITYNSGTSSMNTNSLQSGLNTFMVTLVDTNPSLPDTITFLVNDSLTGPCEERIPVHLECTDNCGLTIDSSCTHATCDGIDPVTNQPTYTVEFELAYSGTPGSILNITSYQGTITGIPANIILPDQPYYLVSLAGQVTTNLGYMCFHFTVTDSFNNICTFDTCLDLPVLDCYPTCGWPQLSEETGCTVDTNGNQQITYSLQLSDNSPMSPNYVWVFSNAGPTYNFTASHTPPVLTINGGLQVDRDVSPLTLYIIVSDPSLGYCAQSVIIPDPCDTAAQVARKMMVLLPNPASAKVTIKYTFDGGTKNSVVITDVAGHTVQRFDGVGIEGKLGYDLSNMEAGIYFVSMVEDGTVQEVQRLVITK